MVLVKLISFDSKKVKLISADSLESFLVKAEQKLEYKIDKILLENSQREISDESDFKKLLDKSKEITLIALKQKSQKNELDNFEIQDQIQNLKPDENEEDDGIKYFYSEYQQRILITMNSNVNEPHLIPIYLFNYESHDKVIEKKKNFNLKYFLNEENEKILRISDDQDRDFLIVRTLFTDKKFQIEIEVKKGTIDLIFSSSKDCCIFHKWLTESPSEAIKNLQTCDQHDEMVKSLIEDSFLIDLKLNPKIGINSRTYLSNTVKQMMEKFRNNNYYAPFSVICQSSGFGKSRACVSLVDEGFYVVYCCLRPKESKGFPKRSCLADDFLNTELDLKKYFKCYFSTFIELLNDTEQDCRQFFEKYQQEKGAKNNIIYKSVDGKYNDLADEVNIPEYSGDKPLIFVFDEASNLLKARKNGRSNYFILRSILSELKKNIFVLFLDTFSHLSEFMPITANDPSNRVFSGHLELFEPIYLLPNWDLFVALDTIGSIHDSVQYENICKFGRALWGSWIYTQTNSNGKYKTLDCKQLYHLAASKLICSKSFDDEFDENDCLAILSSRIGIIKPKCLSTCQEMVAKNMAVCTYVDNQRNVFEIDYPSEPILAEAAAYLINSKKKPEYFVEKLIFMIESSLISKGDKGEIIAKLILVFTKDKSPDASIPKYPLQFTKLVYVGEFIKSLFGKCGNNCASIGNNWTCLSNSKFCCVRMIKRQIDNAHVLLSGLINFTHFVKPKQYMNKTSLVLALKRCAAFHCKIGQKAIDLVIPVSCNMDNFDLISAIVVQVKLWNDPSEPEYSTIIGNIDSSLFYDMSKDVPYLVLYMQLGAPKDNKPPYLKDVKISEKGSESKIQAVIYSQGISRKNFPSLNKSLESKLKAFATSNEKLFKLRGDKKNLKIYNTIRFF